jgi:hypothetical protein
MSQHNDVYRAPSWKLCSQEPAVSVSNSCSTHATIAGTKNASKASLGEPAAMKADLPAKQTTMMLKQLLQARYARALSIYPPATATAAGPSTFLRVPDMSLLLTPLTGPAAAAAAAAAAGAACHSNTKPLGAISDHA